MGRTGEGTQQRIRIELSVRGPLGALLTGSNGTEEVEETL